VTAFGRGRGLAEAWRLACGARFDAQLVTALAGLALGAPFLPAGGPGPIVHPLLPITGGFLLARLAIWKDSPRALLRWLPVLALGVIYSALDSRVGITHAVMRLTGITPKDQIMLAIDRALFFGRTPAQWFDTDLLASPGALRFFHAWYLLGYFPMIAVSLAVVHLKGTEQAFLAARRRVVLLYLSGYALYGLVPVTGPFRFEALAGGFRHPDAGISLVQSATAAFDCFPSLHTAGSILFVWILWPNLGRGWRSLAVFNAALVILTTLTTRAHYGIDVIAGAAFLGVFLAVLPLFEGIAHTKTRAPVSGAQR